MSEKMHDTFTFVPERSYRAFRRYDRLSELLRALTIDPDEAGDIGALSPSRKRRYRYSWTMFRERGAASLDAAIHTTSQWIATQSEASTAIVQVTSWYHRAGVWIAYCLAKRHLDHGQKDEYFDGLKISMDIVSRWIEKKSLPSPIERYQSQARGTVSGVISRDLMLTVLDPYTTGAFARRAFDIPYPQPYNNTILWMSETFLAYPR